MHLAKSNTLRLAMTFLPLISATLIASCSQPDPGPADDSPAMEQDEPPASAAGAPRVFFVEPVDGAVLSSPVQMSFGAENFIIEPAGDETVHEGAGHMHIGIDTDCLPPGVVIQKASPWIHFGDGSMQIEMQLEAGTHRLCLQVGDGEHRTLDDPGMSDEITITVS